MTSHTWDSALDPAISPLFLALQWAQARSLDNMRPVLDKFQLSLAEFDVLATLRNAPPPHELTPSEIQNQVVITSGGLTKVMLQLEAAGLVERRASAEDRRVKPVALTDAARPLIEAAMAEMIELARDWIRGALPPDDIAQLTVLLRRLVDAPQAPR